MDSYALFPGPYHRPTGYVNISRTDHTGFNYTISHKFLQSLNRCEHYSVGLVDENNKELCDDNKKMYCIDCFAKKINNGELIDDIWRIVAEYCRDISIIIKDINPYLLCNGSAALRYSN